ncbi:hypothetical protein K4K49_005442 [Colletotrichum sp. SAR 10_70]|nr:hypothetical protein K4K50_010641 [Colletotrichum sp. SAR 10_71]KAI8196002.1 hypothetical protein KHU50_010432 [Colletotrichum sp. SAR 10_65]KAI8197403.1 hypothetical protein K4K49_005442 [Colletotrichum sp. SAR 10_70]KAI8220376.1 hypothetical protein K4K54_008629 [Colletotrichum sp. SAR 10_86]KAI8247755.1 hypothetical protein K4K53_001502 [Colletotrichum sp. SAR 10_77]KAJ3955879.1 hypothetical protein N0V92_007594 [Colletotrichum tropicale]
MKLSSFLATGLLTASALAHNEILSRSEISRRDAMAKRCAGQTAQFHKKRQAKRMAKRAAELEARAGNSSVVINTEGVYYDSIQNNTCVLTPEVTEGPYVWPRSQTLRMDMTEGEVGVPLTLDVGILDMATCEPLPDALVSFWHCNATGSYSSFTHLSPNTRFEELLNQLNITDFEIGVTDLHTDDTTFLRGMWPTNSEGIMEMQTIFPGFYVERAIHIHTQVFTDWSVRANGTVSSGNLINTGQIYFDEDVSAQIMALEPYVSHTQINRTKNVEDSQSLFDQSTVGGYSPIIEVVPLDGENIENGMVGYITMGVDTSALES